MLRPLSSSRFPNLPTLRISGFALGLLICCGLVRSACGQINNGGNNGGNNGNVGGIKIDANGVVSQGMTIDTVDALEKKRRKTFAEKNFASDLNQKTNLRKVSLVKWQREILERSDKGEPIPNELQFLAGLQRVDYLFVVPDEKDVVIAGPAEGFSPDRAGRVVGVTTGRPVLRFDDWLIAARALIPPKRGDRRDGQFRGRELGCSIDPTKEGIASLQNFLAKNSYPASLDVVIARYGMMTEALGMQNVSVFGIPDDSHFAYVFVEADYRMKRISLGLEQPPVRSLRSNLSMMQSAGNSMQRWWFAPLYTKLFKSPDGLSFHLEGPRAQLLSQDEMIDREGNRSIAANKPSTQAWAKHFTEKFPELAEASPCFGELQNLFDWAILSAIIHREQIPEKAGWDLAPLLDPDRLTYEKTQPPKQVPSQANTKRASAGMVLGLVGGGVTIQPDAALGAIPERISAADYFDGQRASQINTQPNPKHPWWWD